MKKTTAKYTYGLSLPLRLTIITVVIFAASLLHGTGILQPFENRLYDFRIMLLSTQVRPAEDIIVLAIDDESLRRMEPAVGRWPWPRSIMATVLDYCSGAKTITFDVLYSEGDWQYGGSDELLSLAAAEGSNVVCGIYLKKSPLDAEEESALDAFELPAELARFFPDKRFRSVIGPYAGLRAACRGLGHVNGVAEKDGVTRAYSVAARVNGKLYPSLATAAVLHYLGMTRDQVHVQEGESTLEIGDKRIPFDAGGNFRLNPSRWPHQTFSVVDVVQAWQDETEGRMPSLRRTVFDDKIIVIGFTAVGVRSDTAITSLSSRSGGVNLHLTAIDNILNQNYVHTASEPLTYLLIAAFTLLLLAPSLGRPSVMAPSALMIVLLYLIAAGAVLFMGYTMLPVLAPVLSVVSASSVLASFGWFRDRARTRELEALERAKQAMTDMLVHDLKNNLAPIIMAVEMGKMEPDHSKKNAEFFQVIDQNSRRLILQVNALMDLRKMQEGRMAVEKSLISMHLIAQAVSEALSPAARYCELEITVSAEPENDIKISADPLLLQRVLENLVWNAIKYGESGTRIEMACFGGDTHQYRMEIRNRGLTIPADQQENLFSAFSTGVKGRAADRVSSTGLGLTFCKLAVEAHGGTIQFVSPWPSFGNGVGVIITLPRDSSEEVDLV